MMNRKDIEKIPQGNWINTLLAIVKELKLSEVPQLSAIVQKIAHKNDQHSAEKLVRRLSKAYYEQKISPNLFLSFEQNLEGEILLGHTDDGKPVGLNRQDLVRHTFISGQSGFGKSNLLKLMFLQAKEKGIHVVHIDRKGDLEHAVREGVDSIYWPDIKTNFLCPPDSDVNIYEYRNDFVKAFAELMQFYQRGMSVFLLGVDFLYREFEVYDRWPQWDWNTMQFPTVLDLLAVFKSNDFGKRVKGQGKESLLSIIDKLESLCIELQPIVSCQRGFDVSRLYKENRAINYMLDGLSVEYQNFFIVAEILRYAHYFKTHGPRNDLNMLFVFDETKGILGKANEKMFIVKDLVSKIREWGIGLICADQIPSEISQFFFSNIGTLIMFRHSDGFDLQRLQYSSGLTNDQRLANYSLNPGQAIIRTMRFKDLHKFTVPFTEVEKFIPREEVAILMAPRLEELNQDVIALREASAEQSAIASGQEDRRQDKKPSPPPIDQIVHKLEPEEREFLECLAKDFNRPSSEVYKELGFGESKGYRIKQRLVAKRYICQLATNLGKGGKKATLLVPNPIAYEALGISLPSAGRGKALHKHLQQDLAAQAARQGYAARIEECIGSSEGPDIGLERKGLRIAVEVSVTSKPSTEAERIRKHLGAGYDWVILTFVNRRILEETKALATSKPSAERVKFCLVSDFLEAVKEL
jgi:hypothetical protein